MSEKKEKSKEIKTSQESKFKKCKEGAFAIGNTPEGPDAENKITKRRERAITLLRKFNEESKKLELQIRKINGELKSAEKELNENAKEIEVVHNELNRRKEQLEAIVEISDNYIDLVCEKFNVKKDQILKIKES